MMKDVTPVYVQVSLGTEPNAERVYSVSTVPFTEESFRLKRGKKVPVETLYRSYEDFKAGLVSKFSIPEIYIPDADYFDPTPEEQEYEENPIYRVVPMEEPDFPWEDDARAAVRDALEYADWDFRQKVVTLYDPHESRRFEIYDSIDELRTALEERAMIGADNSMPYEGGEAVFDLDSEGIVNAVLEEYGENLKRLGWEL